MTQKKFNSEKKEKEERKIRKKKEKIKRKLIKIAIGTLNTLHILSSTICRPYVPYVYIYIYIYIYIFYINHFIFITYYRDGWFIGL